MGADHVDVGDHPAEPGFEMGKVVAILGGEAFGFGAVEEGTEAADLVARDVRFVVDDDAGDELAAAPLPPP